jgi:hypothetical protein
MQIVQPVPLAVRRKKVSSSRVTCVPVPRCLTTICGLGQAISALECKPHVHMYCFADRLPIPPHVVETLRKKRLVP